MRSTLAIMIFALILCSACNGPVKKSGSQIGDSVIKAAATRSAPQKLTFFDSVFAKMEISHEQIKQHTIINEAYLKPTSLSDPDRIPTFEGDTVYYNGEQNKIVVLRYDDKLVCSKKLLLVYRNAKNTAYQEVGTDCDEDISSNFNSLDYKILGANSFYTLSTFKDRSGERKTKITVTKQLFTINDAGKIKGSPKKLVSTEFVNKAEEDQ